jgi:hypothetical protein
VTYPGFTPVGNATLVVANVLTCNKHSQKKIHTNTRAAHGTKQTLGNSKMLTYRRQLLGLLRGQAVHVGLVRTPTLYIKLL